jgi:glucose/arabinose dehydrogenase
MVARASLAALLASIALLAAGCARGSDVGSPGETVPATVVEPGTGLALEPVAEGFDGALLATARPGDARLLVVEQGGLIKTVSGSAIDPEPFLDLRDLTSPGGERGLLGLAFHPDHADNGLLYVNYTDGDGTTVVAEYRAPRGASRADPASGRTLLTVDQPFSNHNGGHLAFGPDGMLYVGLGDGGSAGDPQDHGQRLDSLLGAMLRVDVDGRDPGRPYAVPPDNPFADGADGARPEIWAFGLRNPWRFAFDPRTGVLWIGDVGQNSVEEIDRVAPGAAGAGSNFGWNRFEGDVPFAAGAAPRPPLVAPVARYGHDQGCSVTGGEVFRGGGVPALNGRYLYGDFCSGRVWTLAADGDPGEPVEITGALGGPVGNLTSFGRDGDGAIYLVTPGAVLRVVAA